MSNVIGISNSGKPILKKPKGISRNQAANLSLSDRGWIYTHPVTGSKEVLVRIRNASKYTTEEAAASEEAVITEESE